MKLNRSIKLSVFVFAMALVASSPLYSAPISTNPIVKALPPAIATRARSMVLPEFKVDGVTLSEAVRQLSATIKQNYPSPANKGINFLINEPATTPVANPKITLNLKNVTVEEATKRLAEAAGVRVTAEDYAFVFDAK